MISSKEYTYPFSYPVICRELETTTTWDNCRFRNNLRERSVFGFKKNIEENNNNNYSWWDVSSRKLVERFQYLERDRIWVCVSTVVRDDICEGMRAEVWEKAWEFGPYLWWLI